MNPLAQRLRNPAAPLDQANNAAAGTGPPVAFPGQGQGPPAWANPVFARSTAQPPGRASATDLAARLTRARGNRPQQPPHLVGPPVFQNHPLPPIFANSLIGHPGLGYGIPGLGATRSF